MNDPPPYYNGGGEIYNQVGNGGNRGGQYPSYVTNVGYGDHGEQAGVGVVVKGKYKPYNP